jgi:hypothetical protein
MHFSTKKLFKKQPQLHCQILSKPQRCNCLSKIIKNTFEFLFYFFIYFKLFNMLNSKIFFI